jgi:TP901 family phage tail tape measure protein
MADENIVTNIVATANFSGLIADVNKITASLSKLQAQIIASDAKLANQVSVMNRSFGENLRRTGQFATHFVTLTSDVEKFGNNLDRGQMKLKQYFQTFQQHTKTQGGLIRDLAKQQVALQNAIIQPMGKNAQGLMQYSVHIPQGLDAVKNKTALARQELQIMNKVIQDGGVQMINWGKNTQWAGRQLTVGLTVPLAAFGMASAKAFREADAELVRLTKVYGGVAATSAADLSKIRNEVSTTAKEISKAYGVSFKDTITLAADIAATGKQGNELLASVKETSRLAVLGEVDRQDAMKATLAIQNTFKQNTDQLSASINFLNAVENQTSTSLADLIEAIPKAGPVIQGMGGSVKDLALYLTAMKEGGINAAEGANALKSALASLINPTKVAKEMFNGMGIDLGGIVTKNAGNLTGTILELQSALDTLDPLKKQQAIEQLFGKFQFARMNALFANLGRQGSQTLQVMDLMKASSQDLASVASRELGMVTESASGKYRRAIEGLKADLADIGGEFLKVQTFFINVTDGILKFVNKLPGPIKTILTFATGLTAIIGPVIMLTGVLANFFGYIIKGASHFRSLFKGGEGWKMLTPEILAANKAGSLIESTFYSDAKAATVLKTAIEGLIAEFTILQQKATAGQISVAPAFSTMAGTMVVPGGRQVDPNHPLLSAQDTRSMSHVNSVAGMTTDQKAAQTIFGVVPGAPKVNQKIGNNPQMYMSGDLPKIPGLTSANGVSTGIVAEEAAKWHAMTGALAMQSDAEIKVLKQEVARTGLITSELSASYEALLPTMTNLVSNAAKESAVIVADLQAGKLTVDQARAKIIALNTQVEGMLAGAAVDIAGQQGRSINLTSVPLLNQPVVDKAGKSNMKELARPGRTRNLLNQIAKGLGVKTFGAPYSIETTIPRRLNSGGKVFTANDGNIVPGTGNTDTVPAILTPGEFVVNKEATQANLPLLQAINGKGSDGPMYGTGSDGPIKEGWDVQTSGLTGDQMSRVIPKFSGDPSRIYTVKGTAGIYIGDVTDPLLVEEFGTKEQKKLGKISKESINLKMKNGSIAGRLLSAAMKSSGNQHKGSTEQFLRALAANGIISETEASTTSNLIYDKYHEVLNRQGVTIGDVNNEYWKLADRRIKQTLSHIPEVENLWNQFSQNVGAHTGDTTSKAGGSGASTSHLAQTLTTTDGKKIKVGALRGVAGSLFAHAMPPEPFLNRLAQSGLGRFIFGALTRGKAASGPLAALPKLRNRGGIIGLHNGGMVPGYAAGGIIPNVLKSTAFKNLGARFGKIGESWGATSMSIGMGRKLFGSSGLTPKAQNLMYGKLIENLEKERPYGYLKDAQGSLQKALEPHIVDGLLKSAAGDVLSSGGKNLSKIDREILRNQFANWNSSKWTPSTTKIRKQMFGMNKGGMVPGYANGGMIPRYGAGALVKSMGLSTLGYMGGQALGSMTGLPGGSMIGGMLGSMLGMGGGGMGMGQSKIQPEGPRMENGMFSKNFSMEHLTKSFGPAEKLASKLKLLGSEGGKFSGVLTRMGPILARLPMAFNPIGIAIAAVTVATVVGINQWKKHQEQLKLNALSYGLTADAAAKAGLKYTDYNQKIKDSIQKSKDLMEANKLAYQSMTSAGIPIKMTITEYQKLKGEVKGAYEEQIKLINSTKNSKLGDVAVQLKEQLIAAGMSADEATKKIYAMFALSQKSGMAASSTVGNKDFSAIQDAQGAAVGSLKGYNSAARLGEAQAQAAALNTSLTAIDTGISEIISKSEEAARKDKSGHTEKISQYNAELKMMEMLKKSQYGQTTITKQTINEMAKANPAIKELASTSDTVVSVWQKLRLQAAGLNGDLSKINAAQAEALYNLSNAINQQIVTANKGTKKDPGLLYDEYNKLETLNKLRANAAKAAMGQSAKAAGDSKARLKELQDQIDATNKLADSRIKALSAAKEDADLNREMQSAKLEVQFAESTGNTQQAAQARLRYQSAVQNMQTTGQTRAIQAAAEKDNAPKLAEIKNINDANDKLATAVSNAGDSIAAFDKQISTLIGTIDRVNAAQQAYDINLSKFLKDNPNSTKSQFDATKSGRELKAGLSAPTKEAGGKAGVDPSTYAVKGITTGGGDITANNIIVGGKGLAEFMAGKDFKIPVKTATNIAGILGNALNLLGADGGNNDTKSYSVSAADLVNQGFSKENIFKGQTVKIAGKNYTIDGGIDRNGNVPLKLKKAGYGMKGLNPNVPTIVGDRGPELVFGNMVIPNLADVPYASPTYNVPSGAKQLGSSTASSGGSTVVVNQSFYQAQGENTDAFMRKVTQATIAAVGRDAKINKSQIGESRTI